MSVNINADTTNGLVLTSDTSGEIKLQAGGADIATVGSSGITMAAGKTLPASALTGSLPAGMGGKILQVLQAQKTDTFSTSSTSFVDVTGLSVSITPSSTSSKILVLANLNWNLYNGHGSARLYRDAVSIAKGDSAGSRIRATWHNSDTVNADIVSASMVWLDEPATTSATTYKIAIAVPYSGTYTVHVNKANNDTDAAYQSRVPSTITVMEVGA